MKDYIRQHQDNTQLQSLIQTVIDTYTKSQHPQRFPLVNSRGKIIGSEQISMTEEVVSLAYNKDLLHTFRFQSGTVIIYDRFAKKLRPIFFGQQNDEDHLKRHNLYINHLIKRSESKEHEIFERDIWDEKIRPGVGIIPAFLIQRFKHKHEQAINWKKLHGISFYEPDLTGSNSIVTKAGRKFFIGGGVITPCIFNEMFLGFSIVEQLDKNSNFEKICNTNEFIVNCVLAPFLYTELVKRLFDLEMYFLYFRKRETDRIAMLPILNKRALYSRLKLYMDMADKKDIPCLSIVFLDMDNFAECNKEVGHQQTDILLVEFTEVLTKLWQENPEVEVARFGGDEFVIILPQIGACKAAEDIERLQTRFEKKLINSRWPDLKKRLSKKLGLSIGIIEYPTDFQEAFDLLNEIEKQNPREYQLIDMVNEHTQKVVKNHGKNAFLLTRKRVKFVQSEQEYANIKDNFFDDYS